MKRTALAMLALAAGLSACEPPPPAFRLVSLKIPPLAPNEYVDRFELATLGVEIVAVCRVPFGWVLTAGADSSVTGAVIGQASVGAAAVSPANGNLEAMRGLVLVKVDAGGADRRPPFVGKAVIATYGDEGAERIAPLGPDQLTMTPAYRCPPPRKDRG